jgi:D-aspartate ligase
LDVNPSRLPVILCDAGFYGTLAAARCLGRAGVPVVLVDPARVYPARFSRYVRRSEVCPPAVQEEEFIDWLLAFGAREGPHVIYPTSDEVAYVLSAHQDELATRFLLYQPPLETMVRVLDKKALLEASRRAGFDVPETWAPESLEEVERALQQADGPLMIKPRTQIFLRYHRKGRVASKSPSLLRDEYARFMRENTYGGSVSLRMPELTQPLLQRYYSEALESIFSVTGFRPKEGGSFPVFGAVKVLQRPRRMGVGLCFEQAPVDPRIASALTRLLDDLGYYGVFEIEFVRVGDKLLLIDMNPRFYNQIALDVARGLPLPHIAYAAAIGDSEEVARLVAAIPSGEAPRAFCNSVGLRMLVGAQRLAGTMSAADARGWQKWRRDRRDILVDSVGDVDDPIPLWVETFSQLYDSIRHPRAFVRMIALDR